MSWSITIPLEPTGQMRVKTCIRGRHAAAYKDRKQLARENAIMAYIARHRPEKMFTGPLEMRMTVYLHVPASKPKKWREGALRGEIRPIVTPDLDNCAKQIKDCLTQMGVWQDDKLVVEYLPGTGKRYSDRPRWEIEVREWRPEVAA